MRKFLGILAFILSVTLIAGPLEAQNPADEEDAQPVQVGYAVITPTTGTSTGLVAFETFGLRAHGHNGFESQAGVIPPALSTSAVIFVESDLRLAKKLGVAIVNPNSSTITVQMTLRNSAGTQVGTIINREILAHHQVAQFVNEFFENQPSALPDGFTGTLALTSAQPFSAIGLRFRGVRFSTLPITSLSGTTAVPTITTGVGGAGAILMPQFATLGRWATQIVVVNNATSSVTVRLDLFQSDGDPLMAALNGAVRKSSYTGQEIAPGGVVVFAPPNAFGDDDF